MPARTISKLVGHSRIDGVVPGVRGQRALPTHELGIIDPFVMLDHIGPEKVSDDFHVDGHMHPHRGFETLTMMFAGTMFHIDSAGYRETLVSGSTQNMVAGSGIQHGGEMAADPDTNMFHEVQLWVNMPAAAKMEPPSIYSAQAGDKPIFRRGHYTVEVITGTIDGQTSPLSTTQPTTVARIQTSGVGPISVDGIDPNWNAVAYVLRGSITAAGHDAEQYQSIVFNNDGDTIELASSAAGSDILLITGEPIGRTRCHGPDPFVMNYPRGDRPGQCRFRLRSIRRRHTRRTGLHETMPINYGQPGWSPSPSSVTELNKTNIRGHVKWISWQ